jgi:hypothetical protein
LRQICVSEASGHGLFGLAAFVLISILTDGSVGNSFGHFILDKFFEPHQVDFLLFKGLKMVINGGDSLNAIDSLEI